MTLQKSLTRRNFLRLGAASACALMVGGCGTSSTTDPGNSAYGFRGFNVHPYPGQLKNVQMQALADIRANWIRTTLGITSDVAGSYVTSARANVLGLISDFQLSSIDKRDWPDMVEEVIRRYPTIRYFQILNEPEVFFDIANAEYVQEYLRPAHDRIREKFPRVKIVSAAPIGQPSGIRDFAVMSAAGADNYCDYRGVHIYFDSALSSPWSAFQVATEKPIMITETGTKTYEEQLTWWSLQIPEMKRILKTEYVFYYALLEQPEYTGYEIILAQFDQQGKVIPAPGSELYNFLAS